MNTNIVKDKTAKIEYGSKAHEFLMSGAYAMTKENAEDIIKRREENPGSVPFEKYEKAQAFLAGLDAKPIPIDTAPGHFRKKNRFTPDDSED